MCMECIYSHDWCCVACIVCYCLQAVIGFGLYVSVCIVTIRLYTVHCLVVECLAVYACSSL